MRWRLLEAALADGGGLAAALLGARKAADWVENGEGPVFHVGIDYSDMPDLTGVVFAEPKRRGGA